MHCLVENLAEPPVFSFTDALSSVGHHNTVRNNGQFAKSTFCVLYTYQILSCDICFSATVNDLKEAGNVNQEVNLTAHQNERSLIFDRLRRMMIIYEERMLLCLEQRSVY